MITGPQSQRDSGGANHGTIGCVRIAPHRYLAGSGMMLRTTFFLLSLLLAAGLHAETRDLDHGIRLQGQFVQGGMVTGTAPAAVSVQFQNRTLPRARSEERRVGKES